VALALRPTFTVQLPMACPEALELLGATLATRPVQLRKTRTPGGGRIEQARDSDHLVVTVQDADQHFWSPWLTVDVTSRPGGSQLVARFSPHPSVWTGFAFGYLTLGVACMFSLVFAGALAMMGGEPWTLWISGGTALALVGMWWASQIGQRLAHVQMELLRRELERAVDDCAVAHARGAELGA
jgi:hypothetical protein